MNFSQADQAFFAADLFSEAGKLVFNIEYFFIFVPKTI